ncbi:MAG TPA: YceD family protein [Candidatus Deferrimicrobium sp.]|nr:YceD family protein [Candidatus Deferrimicrobium sp.]
MTDRDPRATHPASDGPLVWNVAGLLGEGTGGVRDYVVTSVDIDGDEDFTLAGPIDGRVHLARTNRGLLVDADFTTTLATQCARCLRDITVPLAVEIHDEALPSIDFHSGKALALSPEDEEAGVIRLTDHHELDLEQPVREAILLSIPIAPLDRDDCPGLCIVCGLPLDEGTHDHPDDDIDPRLEALRGFVAD